MHTARNFSVPRRGLLQRIDDRFGKGKFHHDFPIIVDIYATRHSTLGASTPEYVEQVMKFAYPVADGVHIYTHQDKHNPKEREKYDVIQRVMSSWRENEKPTKSAQ